MFILLEVWTLVTVSMVHDASHARCNAAQWHALIGVHVQIWGVESQSQCTGMR